MKRDMMGDLSSISNLPGGGPSPIFEGREVVGRSLDLKGWSGSFREKPIIGATWKP
jgi:hypothetical protein